MNGKMQAPQRKGIRASPKSWKSWKYIGTWGASMSCAGNFISVHFKEVCKLPLGTG